MKYILLPVKKIIALAVVMLFVQNNQVHASHMHNVTSMYMADTMYKKQLQAQPMAEKSDAGSEPKFSYAELMFQRNYGAVKFFVNGKTVSPQLKASVTQAKYTDEALELMGEEGWELATSVTRNFDGGFEIYFYLKKQVN